MDTVYLFFENENIKIPFYNYGKDLFIRLIKSNMWHWERPDQNYQISQSGYDTD